MSEKLTEEEWEQGKTIFITIIVIAIIVVVIKTFFSPYIAIGGMFRGISSDLNSSVKIFFQSLSFILSTIYLGFIISVVIQSIESFLVYFKLKRANDKPRSEYENKMYRLAEKNPNKKLGFVYIGVPVVIVISWIIQAIIVWEGSNYIESISETDMVLLIMALSMPIILYILWKIMAKKISIECPSSIVFYRHIIINFKDRFSRT